MFWIGIAIGFVIGGFIASTLMAAIQLTASRHANTHRRQP
jgi:hypothetical protein